MWPIVTTKLIKLCYGSTANTCLINRNNNFKIAKTHTWRVKALRTPSSLRANETKSSQIAFSPKYCWVCKASGTDNEAAETPAWVCTSQLKSQEGVSAGKKVGKFSDEVVAEAFLPLHHGTLLVLLLHLLPSKHRHRHCRLVLRRAVLEIVGSATKYLNWLFCYLEGKFEIITRHLVIGGRWQGGSWSTRQRDFETGGQGDPLFENCVVAELKGDFNYFLYLWLKTCGMSWMVQALMRYFW